MWTRLLNGNTPVQPMIRYLLLFVIIFTKVLFFIFFVDGFSVSGEIIGIHVRNELSGGCFGECHLASESRSRTVFGGAVAFRGNNPAKNAFFEKLNNVNLKKSIFVLFINANFVFCVSLNYCKYSFAYVNLRTSL